MHDHHHNRATHSVVHSTSDERTSSWNSNTLTLGKPGENRPVSDSGGKFITDSSKKNASSSGRYDRNIAAMKPMPWQYPTCAHKQPTTADAHEQPTTADAHGQTQGPIHAQGRAEIGHLGNRRSVEHGRKTRNTGEAEVPHSTITVKTRAAENPRWQGDSTQCTLCSDSTYPLVVLCVRSEDPEEGGLADAACVCEHGVQGEGAVDVALNNLDNIVASGHWPPQQRLIKACTQRKHGNLGRVQSNSSTATAMAR